jgi:hypothetical protein
MLDQSLAREFHPKGIHVVHVIVDGQIDTPKLRSREPNRASETLILPDSIAETILFMHKQNRTPRHTKSTCGPISSHFEKLCTGPVQLGIDLACTLA